MPDRIKRIHHYGSSGEVVRALRISYPANEYAFFEQVATGSRGTGYCDALALNLWESRGHTLHGFEIKISRSDWLRELKKPAKADGIFGYCNFWSLVTSHKDIADLSEIPPPWGWFYLKDGKVFCGKKPPALKPKPLTLRMCSNILRRASECSVPASSVHKENQEYYERGLKEGAASVEPGAVTRNYDMLVARVAEFEKAAGFKITEDWGETIGGEYMRLSEKAEALGLIHKFIDDGNSYRRAMDSIESEGKRLIESVAGLRKVAEMIDQAKAEIVARKPEEPDA